MNELALIIGLLGVASLLVSQVKGRIQAVPVRVPANRKTKKRR